MRRVRLLTGVVICLGIALVVTLRLVLPTPPRPSTAVPIGVLADGVSELYLIPSAHTVREPSRNLLLVVLEDQIERPYLTDLKLLYQSFSEIDIEAVAWWHFAPKLTGIYRQVVRVPPAAVNKQSLAAALSYLESLGEPYDAVFLTHGLPNYLASARGSPPISYQDIGSWSLPHLRLVFMQSCYGASLNGEWLHAGAKVVLSFPGQTRNYFYFGLFLAELQQRPDDVPGAYAAANARLPKLLDDHPFYAAVLARIGTSRQLFLSEARPPQLEAAASLGLQ
jgi:hypothetical protein